MPEISRCFGIVVTMFHNDHLPPHFHVRYQGRRAVIAIEDLTLLRGTIAARAYGLVVEWALIHRAELLEDWQLARRAQPLKRIDPLQ